MPSKKLTAVAAFALTSIAATPGQAVVTPGAFQQFQQLTVLACAWNQVLFYEYATQQTATSAVEYAQRQVFYNIVLNSYLGMFLYDYQFARFTAAYYALGQENLQAE